MRIFFALVLILILFGCSSTKEVSKVNTLRVLTIPLPKELADPEKQFSGLFIAFNKLWLLPECRIQENNESVLFGIPLSSLDDVTGNKTGSIEYKKIPIAGLVYLKNKIELQGQKYEGLEAMVIQANKIYLSVETNTPSPFEFLFKGDINEDRVLLDTSRLYVFRKPLKNGQPIYNASIEALSIYDDKLFAVFEYNTFPGGNFAYIIDTAFTGKMDSVSIDPVPYRITDMSFTLPAHAAAINYFYSGGGRDSEFRPSRDEPWYAQVTDSSGFFSYSRLLDLHFSKNKTTWSVIGEMPKQYWQYNWEGIAAYKNGYFLINDKYTTNRPYQSVLVFVKP
jgi:hypothetical protein